MEDKMAAIGPHAYLEARLRAQDEVIRLLMATHAREHTMAWEAHAEQHRLIASATALSAENMTTRLMGMNEWREQSRERELHFVTREVFAALLERIRTLELGDSRRQGAMMVVGGAVAAAVSLAIVLVSKLVT